MVENFVKMMEGSLNLEEPWYVEGAEFNEIESAVHIYVNVRKNAVFACPKCGGETKRYGYEPTERIWRHGDCMFFPSYVHCRRPRVQCPKCGVNQINAPYERKNSRFTLLFEGYAMLIMADMPRAKAAQVLRCDEKSLCNILTYWVEKAVAERSLNDVTSLAIDETSFKKGHSYVTVVVDADQRRVVGVEEGRDKAAVHAFAEFFKQHGGDEMKVTSVSSDMSKSYVPAIAEAFPEASHVIDKFHVKQAAQKALDEVRKQEQREVDDKKALFQGRRLFMIPRSKMSEKQSYKLIELSKEFPKTGRAYRIVSALDEMYACSTREDAEDAFDSLYSWMRHSRLEPMKEVALMLLRHKDKVLAYFDYRLTNAICEGINSMIQAAKRKARGYNTYQGYRSMIFLIAGKLELAVPQPF